MLSIALYLAHNDVTPRIVKDVPQDSTQWIKSLPRGAYTTARTWRGTHLMEFEQHVQRTCQSLRSIKRDEHPSKYLDPTVLRAALLETLPQLLRAGEEAKLTWVVSGDDLAIHRCAPLVPPSAPIHVTVSALRREDPACKDTQWVHARPSVRANEEVVLVTDTGDVLEGLSSNFLVYTASGELHTAPQGTALQGTVLTLLIEGCAHLQIPVRRVAPSLHTRHTWLTPCISSTSRGILPVASLVPGPGLEPVHFPNIAPEILKLQKWLQETREARATQILVTS